MNTMKNKQNLRKVGQQCPVCTTWNILRILGWSGSARFFTMSGCVCGKRLYWDDRDIEVTQGA